MSLSPKILFIAFACEPGRGSEWGLAWNFINEIARTQEVWVIAHADNRDALEAYLKTQHKGRPVHATYVRLPQMFEWMLHSSYTLLNVYYYLWQFAAARAARKQHREIGFDVVQHLSYCRWWMPSAGATLAGRGAKFIFGPVAGGDLVPLQFRNSFPAPARRSEKLRRFSRGFWRRDPLLKRMVRRAAIVLPSTPLAESGLRALRPQRLEVYPCVALGDPAQIEAGRNHRAARRPSDKLRVVSVGGVTHYRGIDLTLRAIAQAQLSDIEFVHACGGAELETMKSLARELGIEKQVTWLGETNQLTNIQALAEADIFVHVTLRDNQGLALEAMALGIPAIVFDHNSSSLMVGDGCGKRVHIDDQTTPQQAVDEIAATLRNWHDRRELLAEMGERAIVHSQKFTHDARGGWFRSLYADLVGNEIAEQHQKSEVRNQRSEVNNRKSESSED